MSGTVDSPCGRIPRQNVFSRSKGVEHCTPILLFGFVKNCIRYLRVECCTSEAVDRTPLGESVSRLLGVCCLRILPLFNRFNKRIALSE